MGNQKSVFLSFSSRDMYYVNEFMAALKYQGVDVWDYSNEIESIEAGTFIEERLKTEIDTRDIFIPIISANSIDKKIGQYTRLETNYALKANKEILAIKHPEAPVSKAWKSPYSNFKDKLYLDFDIWDDRAFIQALIKLCGKLNVDFQPLDKAHEKLPFWSDFRREVAEIPKSNYHHSLMMEYLWTFNKYFFTEDYVKAELMVRIFVENCQYLLPDYKPFYPLHVWAVCFRHLEKQDEAEICYKKAKANRPGYDEENIYAGLGGVYLERKDYQKSFYYYKKSLEACTSEFNADEKYNFAVASLNAEKEIDPSLEDFVLEMKENHWGKRSVYLYHAKSLIFSRRKEYELAISKLEKGIRSGHFDENTYLFKSRNICMLNKQLEAIALLEDTLETRFPESKILAREIMELTKSIPDYPRAKLYFERYILTEENSREELIEYALLCYYSDDPDKAVETAQKIIEYTKSHFPTTPQDLYYDGFAHYIFKEMDKAACYFEKANLDRDYYDKYI